MWLQNHLFSFFCVILYCVSYLNPNETVWWPTAINFTRLNDRWEGSMLFQLLLLTFKSIVLHYNSRMSWIAHVLTLVVFLEVTLNLTVRNSSFELQLRNFSISIYSLATTIEVRIIILDLLHLFKENISFDKRSCWSKLSCSATTHVESIL